MEKLLNRQEQDNIISLIVQSGLCNSNIKRRTFLIKINLKPEYHEIETLEYDFLVNLINYLVEARTQNVLKLIIQQISNSCPGSHQEVRYLENKLNSAIYRPSLPVSKPAFFVDDKPFQLMPLDIGTIWGLQRSSFIGLLIGFEKTGVYENFKNVEFTLSQAIEANQKFNQSTTVLPNREWIQIDINRHDVPCQKAQIIDAAIDITQTIVDNLTNESFPNSSILGFFFEIEVKQLDRGGNYSEKIKDWCNALLNQLFPLQSVALIINLIHSLDEDAERSVLKLRSKLREITGEIPIELMRLDPWLFLKNNLSYPINNHPNLIDIKREPGLLFCSWMYALTRSFQRDNLSNAKKRYRDLMDLYVKLNEQYSEIELRDTYSGITSRNVVLDIQAIAPSIMDKAYYQLLYLIVKFCPQLSCQWVSTYAESAIEEAVCAALIIATNAGLLSDILMDSWIDAIDLDRFNIGLLYQDGGDYPDCYNINNLKIEGLLLALIRKEQESSNIKIKTLLQELVHRHPDLNEFYHFCQSPKEKENEFLNQNNAQNFILAIRAKVRLEGVINQFKATSVSNLSSPICWLLAAIPPSKNNIMELLQLEPKKRAVFGLCTHLEWQEIKRREEREREVLDCRRDRYLIFSTSTHI